MKNYSKNAHYVLLGYFAPHTANSLGLDCLLIHTSGGSYYYPQIRGGTR